MKKLWRRHKKNLYGTIAFVSFFIVLGSVGAMEHDTVPFWQGVGQVFFFMASFAFFTYLAGGFEEMGHEFARFDERTKAEPSVIRSCYQRTKNTGC